jgi:uncharacterized membrane-anchored protein YitT (DUF2179 family)
MSNPLSRWAGRVRQSIASRAPLWQRLRRAITDLALIVAGVVLMALAVDVFFDPNDVVPGGFTALSMFANRLWGFPVGITLLALNVPFLILGVRILGAQFGPKTILAAVLVSLAIDGLRPYAPTVRGEPMLYVFYGGIIYGFGQALVFRANATSGGTEIPAKLLQHLRGLRMSSTLLSMDIAIFAMAAAFFGLAPALYAIISSWVMSRVIDFVETGVDAAISAFIVTGKHEAVVAAILSEMGRGATILRGEGGYTGAARPVVFTVVSQREATKLRELVSRCDPDAFMVVNPSHEVLGEGFKPLTRVRGGKRE